LTGAAALVWAALLGWLIWAAYFAKAKARWHPFGGMFHRDKKTGAIVMALTLPTKRGKRRKR
jgi:hypothetical protein